ncbi:FAD-binding oxidoreductase [Bradyrhizobium stylosanthis]|uniref:Flavin-dependent oxidoreductase n=2 Tax=Bradyrhizobium stylosanthis TaxID=1803665 RepID=A0A560CVQ8_9BRAD|nr:FAD-binding oxidoreductase [Bradyrhizobium stylosanthis]TWA88943.1 flavin-dependent oxidoreductase [Bradyrhizobium stylosanthis]
MAKPTEPISACLRATRDLTPDVRLFEIEPDSPLVNLGPGSHIDVLVPTDGRPQLRSYSLAGSCADGLYRIAVKRLASSRGGSIGMWRLKAGERLTIF